jgi:hypothetical protein
VKKINDPATAPTVPTMVIAFGVIPARASRPPSGASARDIAARAWMFSTQHESGSRGQPQCRPR